MNYQDNEYSRAQIDEALWRVFAPINQNPRGVDRIFKTRVKKLIECDSAARLAMERKERPALPTPYVFSPGPLEPGKATIYSQLDAICLAVGIELTDIGRKQTEALELVRRARPHIQEHLRKYAYEIRNLGEELHHPKLRNTASPTTTSLDAKGPNDNTRTYIIFKTTELHETRSGSDDTTPAEMIIEEPIICKGIEELTSEIKNFSSPKMRSFITVELGYLSAITVKQLRTMAMVGRGRPIGRFG